MNSLYQKRGHLTLKEGSSLRRRFRKGRAVWCFTVSVISSLLYLNISRGSSSHLRFVLFTRTDPFCEGLTVCAWIKAQYCVVKVIERNIVTDTPSDGSICCGTNYDVIYVSSIIRNIPPTWPLICIFDVISYLFTLLPLQWTSLGSTSLNSDRRSSDDCDCSDICHALHTQHLSEASFSKALELVYFCASAIEQTESKWYLNEGTKSDTHWSSPEREELPLTNSKGAIPFTDK